MLYSPKLRHGMAAAGLTLLLAYPPFSQPSSSPHDQQCRVGDRYLFGYLETVTGIDNQFDTQLTALVDSGSTTSSMDARDITVRRMPNGTDWVRFTLLTDRDGQGKEVTLVKPIERFINVITHSGPPDRRPVIEATIELNNINVTTEFSLTSRAQFPQSILLGRNTLDELAVIDTSRNFLLDQCLVSR
ncbi:RimK/LysX family protein [uncultured Endozoicomonas sp.]|uniref:ATP-dependent zinc protease family protein n=1 Tax=uncultured Endozoicomonas sp. TaxID=432652 RepID=UPI002631F6B7|nr:RimK/LysX family protein [uncultured Endozoicomonas sp.]